VRFRHLRRSILRPSVQRYREGTVSRYVGTEGAAFRREGPPNAIREQAEELGRARNFANVPTAAHFYIQLNLTFRVVDSPALITTRRVVRIPSSELVEWSGVEWSGVEWSGVEWSGVEWSGVVLRPIGLPIQHTEYVRARRYAASEKERRSRARVPSHRSPKSTVFTIERTRADVVSLRL
jgi:hypothetical protein